MILGAACQEVRAAEAVGEIAATVFLFTAAAAGLVFSAPAIVVWARLEPVLGWWRHQVFGVETNDDLRLCEPDGSDQGHDCDYELHDRGVEWENPCKLI